MGFLNRKVHLSPPSHPQTVAGIQTREPVGVILLQVVTRGKGYRNLSKAAPSTSGHSSASPAPLFLESWAEASHSPHGLGNLDRLLFHWGHCASHCGDTWDGALRPGQRAGCPTLAGLPDCAHTQLV